MSVNVDERTKSYLTDLNREMVQMEQKGEAARGYFEPLVSDQLVFRRASGKVDGRSGFLDGLKNNPFETRESADVSAIVEGNRALVTLVVVGKRKDDGSVHLYRNIRLFSRSGDKWVLEFWYNYEFPNL